jgi:hypothetical protein
MKRKKPGKLRSRRFAAEQISLQHTTTAPDCCAVEKLTVDELLDGAFLDGSKSTQEEHGTKSAALAYGLRGECICLVWAVHLHGFEALRLKPWLWRTSGVWACTGEKTNGNRKSKRRKKDEGSAFQVICKNCMCIKSRRCTTFAPGSE